MRQVLEHLPKYPSLLAAAEAVARREGVSASLGGAGPDRRRSTPGRDHRGAGADQELKAKVRRLEEDNEIRRRASFSIAGELDPRNR